MTTDRGRLRQLSAGAAALAFVLLGGHEPAWSQQGAAPAAEASRGVVLELVEGSRARYRVREQLAGISFPSDAVGVAEGVTGTLVLRPDGSIDSARSKLTLDLRRFRSDQDMRDGYIQKRTLETDRFPLAEFVPRRASGLVLPFPTAPTAQAGFELTGDMMLHGVTRELTWRVVATFPEGRVTGIASTSFPFSAFDLTKPSLARLISVDDTINLEVEFRARVEPAAN
jgi:polyisoprenoid-binding protein YceI